MRRLTAAVLPLMLLLASCSGGTAATGSAYEAETAARSYIESYDARDGSAICDAFAAELKRSVEEAAGTLHTDCPKLVAAYIGYGEESDTPQFRHVTVRSVGAQVTGDVAHVRVREALSYETSDPQRAHIETTDVIYLLWRDGRWQVAKPGAIYYASRSAYQVPPSALDRPVLDSEAGAPAPRRGIAPSCGGTTLAHWSDPNDDAPMQVDLTGVAARSLPGATCVQFSSRSVPPPGTIYTVSLEQPIDLDAFRPLDASVRVGHAGELSIAADDTMVGGQAGWNGDVLTLVIPQRIWPVDPTAPVHLSARLDSVQQAEPLIAHPLVGGDFIHGDTHMGAEPPPGVASAHGPSADAQPSTLEACVDAWNASDPGRAPIGYDPLGDTVDSEAPSHPAQQGFIARSASVGSLAGTCRADFRLGSVHAVFQQLPDGNWYGFSFLNPDLWQSAPNACQAVDGTLALAQQCAPIQVPPAQRRPLLKEYEQFARRRALHAVSGGNGPAWWAGPRLHASALALPNPDIAWAARALAAVVYSWQTLPDDPAQPAAQFQLVVLTYHRAAAPATLPCGSPCHGAYTILKRIDWGSATVLLISRVGDAPSTRDVRAIVSRLAQLRS